MLAQVAETIYVTGGGTAKRRRAASRRAPHPPHRSAPAALWPDWRHHAFVTNLELDTVEADRFHRDHASIELAIRDLKEGAGLEHCPSGQFFANAAWLGCAVLAHNLIRWTARSARSIPTISSPSPAPCAPASSPSPAAS